MQTAYRIEIINIFGADAGNLVAHSPIAKPNIIYDYITLAPFEVICTKKIQCQENNYVFIYEDNNIIFEGIVGGIIQQKRNTVLAIKPTQALLDNQFYIDDFILDGGDGIATWNTVVNTYYLILGFLGVPNPVDYRVDIKGYINAPIDDTLLHNGWNVFLKVLYANDVYFNIKFDKPTNKLILEGRKCEAPKHIECALENVVDYKIHHSETKKNINKIYFYVAEYISENVFLQLYDIVGEGTNYTIDVIPEGIENKEEYADLKSAEIFNNAKYETHFEITVRQKDYPNYNVCDLIKIVEGGKVYDTMLTKIEYQGELKIMTFGAVRLDLTDILSIERRKLK